ncbi:MAG: Uma2 family endonuclease, partial [Fimbriimonadales bacterium]|nr:Uma2 family endonuclease [Fimbriimonadales bacterium]
MSATVLTKRAARKPRKQARDAVRLYRFTPAQFYQLYEAGLLDPNKRYELIEGAIYEMTIGPEHGFGVDNLQELLLQARKPGEYYFRIQGALQLGDSQPTPDIAVIPGKPDDYRQQHPTTALLVIEVADTSLSHDRGRKLRLYAKHGIPEYWIVNLKQRVLEVYREPERNTYKSKH